MIWVSVPVHGFEIRSTGNTAILVLDNYRKNIRIVEVDSRDLFDMGAYEVVIADTIGIATP